MAQINVPEGRKSWTEVRRLRQLFLKMRIEVIFFVRYVKIKVRQKSDKLIKTQMGYVNFVRGLFVKMIQISILLGWYKVRGWYWIETDR